MSENFNKTTPDNVIVSTLEVTEKMYEELRSKYITARNTYKDTIEFKNNILRTRYVLYLLDYIENIHPEWIKQN